MLEGGGKQLLCFQKGYVLHLYDFCSDGKKENSVDVVCYFCYEWNCKLFDWIVPRNRNYMVIIP